MRRSRGPAACSRGRGATAAAPGVPHGRSGVRPPWEELVERVATEDLIDALEGSRTGGAVRSVWVAECSSKYISGWASA